MRIDIKAAFINLPHKKNSLMNPFQPIALSSADTDELQAVTRTILAANLNRYQRFKDVDPISWRLVKCRDQMRMYAERRYQRRNSSTQRNLTDDVELQTMLCVGSTPGSLEEVMSGVAVPQFNPAQTKTSANDINGATTLAKIQEPTLKHPFHSVNVKWVELDVRRRSMGYIKNRDYTYVEATGTAHLPRTGRVGYHLMHSVDIIQAPALPGRIRGKLSVCFFFRQEKENSVSVYAMWMMNPMNERARRVIVPHFAQMLLSMFTSTQDSRIKRLKDTLGKSYAELNNFKGVQLTTPFYTCVTCSKRVWAFGKLTSQHNTCKICLGHICNSCKIDKKPKFFTSNVKETTKDYTLCFSCLGNVITAENSELSKTKNPRNGSGLLRRMCHSVRTLRSPGWGTKSNEPSASFSN
ncbi:hypothetical protein GN244_ATG03561 [Phytophthora infestans]|uniref:FYVE-type domain-containing protein n=1 Tax=Phytophthora infestans TaxID=4787 RepID=A0A833X031_PHYIN|nr:hypothetical protein GN244_ATG03561 [Phytophthora infestans]KAF4139251.1 hypothetical protein GN958_ATG11611 [Phytophthora infestans]